jgi:hypothetical protein
MGEYMQIRGLLQEGEEYAGLILGKDDPDYHLVLLPGDSADVSWPTAADWAASQGGALPTRRELALLFANLRESFQRDWYWSSEPHATRAQLVWGQNFASGIQTIYGRHARAVRRISTAA